MGKGAKKYANPGAADEGREKNGDRDKFPTEAEVDVLLAYAAKESYRDYMLLYLAVNLGLRVGEVVQLAREDFKAKSVVVHTEKVRRGDPIDEIPAREDVLARVRDYLGILPAYQKYLFASPDRRRPLTTRSATNAFNYYAKKAKLPQKLTFHCLRHYFGARVWRLTKDLRMVQALLRHRTMYSTGTYVHVFVDDIRNVVERLKI